jgi:phage baseplate assembly protein W
MSLYRGISTIDFDRGVREQGIYPSVNVKNFNTVSSQLTKLPNASGSNTLILTDIALVERNILNHLFTAKGSRVMMPDFGTRLAEILYEPLDEFTVSEIYNEIETVVKFDPRVQLIKLLVVPNFIKQSVNVTLTLKYIELNITNDTIFNLEFSQ